MDYIKWLKDNLDKERFEHSLGVSEKAIELAKRFGLDVEKAKLAGLIHDCAKCLSNEELLNIIKNYTDVQECEIISPKTYHAPAGEYIAKTVLGIVDTDILSAIRWHTVGKSNMTDFEKVIFLADKIETRTRPQWLINKITPFLEQENGLNKALLASYKETIKSLVDRNLKICISTINLYNELLDD